MHVLWTLGGLTHVTEKGLANTLKHTLCRSSSCAKPCLLTTAVDELRKKSTVQDNALSSVHQKGIWYCIPSGFLRITVDHRLRYAKRGRFYKVESKQIYINYMVHICFVYANHTTQRGPPATSQPTHVLGRPLKKTTNELQNDACSRCEQNLERRHVLLASFSVARMALMFVMVTLHFSKQTELQHLGWCMGRAAAICI